MAKTISGYAAYRFLIRVKRGQWRFEAGELFVLDFGRRATVHDLRWVKGQAEIVDDKLVVMAPSGWRNARARGALLHALKMYERDNPGEGVVVSSSVAFLVEAPHRRSICADVSWYTGPSSILDFPPLPPVFAAEVRDYANYGDEAEEHFAIKRADYFAAGTQVVWDVDVLREELIRVYRADDPEHPTIYRRGEIADAEPAVPGWRFLVDELWD
ncbi:Uma2 family endonuclease [Longimicrobium sp.]|uniref:Uma2 family endonuclease n=1 Tax=Longimicrobium sp. TaxID=2029185 RepID=UPI002C869DE5|nr:Uma2 family endonuclease [Longimicrobium sp.]HSU13166.1 Uma2 family endonuclease [Longimicrobium sp.]